MSEDARNPQQLLKDIHTEYQYALDAEIAFVEWEKSHKDATCDEFLEQFNRWVDSSLPYVRSRHLIEERFPDLIGKMRSELGIN